MPAHRSLKVPISLAIAMIGLLVVLTVGWVLLAVAGALGDSDDAGLYWGLLTVGTVFIACLVLGVVLYLVLTIKAVNLSHRQSSFINSVTHELKSPIASLKLYLQTLNRRAVNQEEQAGFHRSMLEDVERLDRLISQVLDAGRVESGRGDEELADIDLAQVLSECRDAVCRDYHVPPSTVHLDVEPCFVRARRVDLEMMFRNLIENAVKYAGKVPEVQVALRWEPGGRTLTRISNNGRRIPPKLRRKMFRPFVRLGLDPERQKPGTGLGLYIVRTLVQRLHGRIRVDDREGGTGTVFEVQLPGRPALEPGPGREDPVVGGAPGS